MVRLSGIRAALVAIGIVVLPPAAAAAAEPEIAVAGNHRIGPDGIKAYFHASEPSRLSDADLDAALKAMYRSDEFAKVVIQRDGAIIRVTVEENPQIGRILFEGNRKLDDNKLKPLVQSHKDGPLSPPLVHDDVERLTEAYRHAGRFETQITPKTIEHRGSVDLVFEIREGERVGVREITFTGNKAFADRTLKDVVKSGQTNFLSFLLDNDVYDPDKVEGDRELLRHFYLDHGYADVSVKSAAATYDPEKKSFVVNFSIDEGQPYRIGAVRIDSSLPGVDGPSLQGLLLTRSGEAYNADAVQKSIEAVAKDLARHGKPFVDVKPQAQRASDRGTLDIVYNVQPAAPLYVERIVIHGNTTTRDDVIRRELELGEGDAFNSALLDASERRLKKLGYFKSVKLTRTPGSAPDRTVIDVAVEEQNTGNFWISGGYGDQDGWIGEVSISDRNMFGRGEVGKVSLTYGQYSRGFDVGFTEPYVLGQRVSLSLDAFDKQTDSSSYQSYSSLVYGASATVGTPLTDTATLSWLYSIRNQSLTLDPTRGIASIPVQQAAAAGPQWISMIGAGITYDTLDSDAHPTSGLKTTINDNIAGLGGDVRYLSNTDDLKYYSDLGGGVIGLAHLQSGYITPWGGQSLPLLDGFFGGPSLVRGFAPSGFGPRDLTPGTTQDNLGGNAYWATSYELQAPIPMVPQAVGLKAAVFADAGSLWGTSSANYSPALSSSLVGNSQTVRSSVGIGLVWDSILGPLRVDYAYPVSKASYDITQRVHFGYGGF